MKYNEGSQTAIIGSKGALFYALMSIVMPDLKSTLKWSSKTVIFSIRRLTSLIKLCDGSRLAFDEILQITDLLHLFILDYAVHLGLPALIP